MIVTEARYIKIADKLENGFPKMLLNGKHKLPSESELCDMFSCSRQTVRAALKELQKRNLIIKCHGSGSFISESSSRSNTVALIFPRQSEYIYPGMISTIESFFSKYSFKVRCFSTQHSIFTEREVLKTLVNDPPAGIIMECAGIDELCMCGDLLKQLEEKKIPVVYLGSAYSLPTDAAHILHDEKMSAYHLTDTLIRHGCKRIICLMRENNSQSMGRYAGCALACIDSGAAFTENQVCWLSNAEYENILNGEYDRLKVFLREYIGKDTALVCCSDEIAYHAINALKYLGCSAPEDISVAGFDNSYYTTQSDTGITSVDMGANKCAANAAEAMLALLTGRKPEEYEVPTKLILRRSTK